jgi:ATP-binding protein involved in chromosome partitioning
MKSYADIAGDGGSDVVGQVSAQKEAIASALAGVRRRLAVASGKGGVGKSTLTLGLARALARRGRRVAILDADFNGPTQAQIAGLAGRPWVPGPRGLALPRRPDGIGVVSLGSPLAAGAELRFDTVSRGEQHTWRATREFAMLGQLLGAVDWGEQDVLLFDLPPGAERTVQYAEFLGPETELLMVTIPSDVAHGVVARSLAAVAGTGSPVLGYVENMAGYWCAECGAVRPLFPDSTADLGVPRLGRVAFDPRLAALCDRGWPADEEPAMEPGGALAAIDAVAARIDAAPEADRSGARRSAPAAPGPNSNHPNPEHPNQDHPSPSHPNPSQPNPSHPHPETRR